MAVPQDNTSFSLTSSAGGVDISINVDIFLSPITGGPYSQLFLQSIDMTVQRSSDNVSFSDLATYVLSGVGSTTYNGNFQHTDSTAVSGNTYYYRIKNVIDHFEQTGTPQ